MKSYTINKFNYLSTPKNQKIGLVSVGILIIVIIASIIGVANINNGEKTNDNTEKSVNHFSIEEIPKSTEGTSETPVSSPLYRVISVTDGDTIEIDYNGVETPVRLIGVNTPETVDPRTTVECFGIEASNFLKSLLSNKNVSIAADPTQSDRDKYNRLLRYVYLDGEDIGYKIISSGYGYEYTYNVPYEKQSEYKSVQNEASKAERGLWSPSTCNGNKETPTVPATPQPSSQPEAKPGTSPQSQVNCNIKGNISSKGEKIYHVPGQKILQCYQDRYFKR